MGKTVKRFLALIFCLTFVFLAGCNSGDPTGDWVTTADTEDIATTDAPETDIPEAKLEMRDDQVYAADLIGEADNITVAFMGGSLTSAGIEYNSLIPGWPISGNRWVSDMLNYFVTDGGVYKVRSVNAFNAALPGTTSDYAAMRFHDQVAIHEPDIIFLEYSCNDRNWGANDASLYYENIIRECLTLDKIPVIIIVHAVVPIDTDHPSYKKYAAGIAEKDALAEHYGIKTVNTYDYLRLQYESENTGLSFYDYIGPAGKGYYTLAEEGSSELYDVHPNPGGATIFSAAVLKALAEDYEGTMAKIKFADVYNTDSKEYVNSTFTLVNPDDERISFEGEWTLYTAESPFVTDDENVAISEDKYLYPNFSDGIMQTINSAGASFTVRTTASAISLPHVNSLAGSSAKAYLVNDDGSNGEELTTVTVYSIYNGMNYYTGWVNLPDDGEEHTVRFVVDDPTETNYVFRFGYLVERFNKK